MSRSTHIQAQLGRVRVDERTANATTGELVGDRIA
jgi:hypothetical protein